PLKLGPPQKRAQHARALRPNGFQVARFAGADHHPHRRPPTRSVGGLGEADPGPAIAGRQSCTADRRPSRDPLPPSALPQNLEKSILFCLSAFKSADWGGIAALHKRNHFENTSKRCTLLGSGNNLTEENPPTCPYKRTLRSSNDGTRRWKRKLPKP